MTATWLMILHWNWREINVSSAVHIFIDEKSKAYLRKIALVWQTCRKDDAQQNLVNFQQCQDAQNYSGIKI